MILHFNSEFTRFSEWTYGGETVEIKDGIDVELTPDLHSRDLARLREVCLVAFRVLNSSR
jgi:hypothetical protein